MMSNLKYSQANKSSRHVLIALTLLLLVLGFVPAPEFSGIVDYLPVHSFLELIAIGVAACVFTVGWYTYLGKADYRTVSVACLFLGVAVLDVSHVLSFQGMPDFVTPSGPDKTINFWFAARSLAALALVAAVLMPATRAPVVYRYSLLTAVALIVAGLHVLFLNYPQLAPDNFDQEAGLTAFKVGLEFVLILVYGLAAYILWQRSVETKRVDTLYLALAAAIMALSEMLFTRYINLFDVYNVTGHLYKVFAYAYLYQALVVTGIVSPYQSLAASNSRLLATLDSIPDLMFEIKSDGTIVSYHSSIDDSELLAPPSVFIGRKLQEFLSDDAYEVCRQAFADIDQDGRTAGRSYSLEREDGERYYEISGASIVVSGNAVGDSGPNYLLLARDVTEQRNAEEEISKLSNFDPLTGLANRRRLLSLLEQNVARSVALKRFGALLMIDLDGFKVINDTLGHQAGDELLISVAERLQRLVQPRDTVARYGGDEFVVVLAALDGNAARAATMAQQVALSILTELEGTYQLSASPFYSSCSIGVTLFGEGFADTGELIKQMDIALFQAKDDGGNAIRFFDQAWQTAVGERALLLAELRVAIRQHQFELYYQPQWDVDGVVLGAEALVRWNHPVRGVVPPLEFIPFAEQNGLILALGHEVLELGLAKIKEWQRVPQCQNLKLSINLVPEQFYEDGFAKTLISRLQELGIDSRLLMLEFTESTLMDNLELAKLNMQQLSETGVQFAIDDFGTGYSSLTYLSQLPLNMLKIDQSFVRNIGLMGKDAAIVRTIINMAHSLEMEVIAEGVETENQRDFLFSHDCTLYQGYLFGRPVPALQFEAERAVKIKRPG